MTKRQDNPLLPTHEARPRHTRVKRRGVPRPAPAVSRTLGNWFPTPMGKRLATHFFGSRWAKTDMANPCFFPNDTMRFRVPYQEKAAF